MRRVAMPAARVALAVVFIWFGALKVFGASPAIELVTRTVYWVDPAWFVPLLGWWEVAIGVCVLDPRWWVRWARDGESRGGWFTRVGLLLLFLQMPGTFLPLVLLPSVCFQSNGAPTLEGQYIVKNLALIAATLFVGGGVGTGRAATGVAQGVRVRRR
jgi:uncharacterized membrane protein YkgB